MELLRIGSYGDDVGEVQRLLKKAGYYHCNDCKVDRDYGGLTASAVQEFQGGHLGPDGEPLVPDGVVGKDTWWALNNQHGASQAGGIDPLVPKGLTSQRRKVLDFVCDKYRKGVREIPDGSNSGDGVDDITGGWAVPWCALTVWWAFKEALQREPWGNKWQAAAVINIYREAKEQGVFKDKASYTPRPGDIFIMLYKDANGRYTGKGHTGFVLRVSEDGTTFITLEGNCGNALAVKRRKITQPTLVGFVNPYPTEEQPNDWQRGLVAAGSASSSVASTR